MQHATSIATQNSILTFMLHQNSDVSDPQRVPILSATASSASTFVDAKSNDDFIKMITYERAASVIKQLPRDLSPTFKGSGNRVATINTNTATL